MKYEQKETPIKKSYQWLKISLIALSIVIGLNRFVHYEFRDTGLKLGQMFITQYGSGTMTFIVKKRVVDGVICTSQDWLWRENLYFSNFDLNCSSSFVKLGTWPLYGKKIDEFGAEIKEQTIKNNPLMLLQKYDIFEMVYGSTVVTFIIKARNNNGLVCTSTEWLWATSIFIKWSDYDSNYFVKHSEKYPHKN